MKLASLRGGADGELVVVSRDLERAVALCVIGFPVYAVTLVVTLLLLGPWPV